MPIADYLKIPPPPAYPPSPVSDDDDDEQDDDDDGSQSPRAAHACLTNEHQRPRPPQRQLPPVPESAPANRQRGGSVMTESHYEEAHVTPTMNMAQQIMRGTKFV
jgi:hypothetical protein